MSSVLHRTHSFLFGLQEQCQNETDHRRGKEQKEKGAFRDFDFYVRGEFSDGSQSGEGKVGQIDLVIRVKRTAHRKRDGGCA